MFHHVRGELLTARELGEQLLGLAQREHDPALLMATHSTLGTTLFHLGEFSAAWAHLEPCLTFYEAQRRHFHVFPYGSLAPGVVGLSSTCGVLWSLGYPDQARQKSEAARTLGQEVSHPFSCGRRPGFCYHVTPAPPGKSTDPRMGRGNHPPGPASTDFHSGRGLGTILRGWAFADQGQSEEGISQIRQGLATRQALGVGVFQSYDLALLAEAYGKAGQVEEGLATLAEALTVVDKSGERFYEAELYRLIAIFRWVRPDSHNGETTPECRAR